MRRGDIRIGISGWNYPPWRGNFYPKGLPHKAELAHAASVFNAIEINATFYRLQAPATYGKWFEQTPANFLFAIKAPRFITHEKRLRDVSAPLANFLASGVLRLAGKLGPILWQLPPSLHFDRSLLAEFLQQLPGDTIAASRMARNHDEWLRTEPWLDPGGKRPLRHAIEIRHESFLTPDFIALLRESGVALVCADSVAWPRLMDATTDFIYCRLHGAGELYRSGYEPEAIELWARRVEAWARGEAPPESRFVDEAEKKPPPRDVFMFFDNTDKLRAPEDAQSLMHRLSHAGHHIVRA